MKFEKSLIQVKVDHLKFVKTWLFLITNFKILKLKAKNHLRIKFKFNYLVKSFLKYFKFL